MSYKFENTISGQLVKQYIDTLKGCIEYKGKSLADWEKRASNNAVRTQARQEAKLEFEKKRQENLKSYREQADKLCRYDHHGQFVGMASGFDRTGLNIDEEGQYRAHMAFAAASQLDLEDH